jgi:Domain of unknown function (DUF4471)
MLAIMWEIEMGMEYRMTKEHDVYSGLGKEAQSLAGEATQEPTLDDILDTADEAPHGSNGDGGAGMSDAPSSLVPSPTAADVLPPPPPPAASIASSSSSSLSSSGRSKVEEDEDEMAKAIKRAECIVDTWRDVKVRLRKYSVYPHRTEEGVAFCSGQVFPIKGLFSGLTDKSKYANHFDAVFVSSRSAQCLDNEKFVSVLKSPALIAVESAKFLVPLRKEQKRAFLEKEIEYAQKLSLRHIPGTANISKYMRTFHYSPPASASVCLSLRTLQLLCFDDIETSMISTKTSLFSRFRSIKRRVMRLRRLEILIMWRFDFQANDNRAPCLEQKIVIYRI